MTALGAGAASAQNFPAKPIYLYTAGAGGGADYAARLIAQGVSGILGQQVVIENRGASPIIPAQAVVKAQPDGYTLLFYSNGLWILPLLQKNVPYDPQKDFVPLTAAASSPNVLVVHASLPVKTIGGFVKLAKPNPGQIDYATGGAGTGAFIATEMFKEVAGINLMHVPYKGGGPALASLLAGETSVSFLPLTTTLLRRLGVTAG